MFEICWWKCCSTAFSFGSWRGGPMMKNPPMRILFTPKGMPHSQPGTHWLCLIRWHIRQLSTYDFMDIFRCWVLNFLSSSPRIANLLVRCPKGVRQFKRFDSKEPMAWRVQAIKLKKPEREQVETTWKHPLNPYQNHHHYIIDHHILFLPKTSCPHRKMECHSGAAPPKE